jgi:hypothetical protein
MLIPTFAYANRTQNQPILNITKNGVADTFDL